MADVCKYGEPSVASRTNTPEFDAGYEAAFGPSKDEIRTPKRTRYVYRNGKCVEMGGPEDTGPENQGEDARLRVVSDLYMVGVSATGKDGKVTDIGSRAKRRDFMRRNDFVDTDDFKNEWAQKAKEREAFLRGEKRDPALRYQLGKTAYELSKKRR